MVALGLENFYGSGLPRLRIYRSLYAVDRSSFANGWIELQGRIRGNVKKLRKQIEKRMDGLNTVFKSTLCPHFKLSKRKAQALCFSFRLYLKSMVFDVRMKGVKVG
ncbi:hypothetical protein L1887_23138 [Cichorium endivia]|nr:hypothetical protein L1887_23138 [Cichorium endivia]